MFSTLLARFVVRVVNKIAEMQPQGENVALECRVEFPFGFSSQEVVADAMSRPDVQNELKRQNRIHGRGFTW